MLLTIHTCARVDRVSHYEPQTQVGRVGRFDAGTLKGQLYARGSMLQAELQGDRERKNDTVASISWQGPHDKEVI
jgi:hypothetical protein